MDKLVAHVGVHTEQAFDAEGGDILVLPFVGSGRDDIAVVEGIGGKDFFQFLVRLF